MVLGNIGVFMMAPLLSASSFLGFGASDGNIFAQARTSNDWREAISQWREARSEDNWNWNRWDRGNSGDGQDENEDPFIRRIDPSDGPVGTEVTLRGSHFDEDSVVRMGEGAINDVEVSRNGRVLSFVIPEYMGQYCPPDRACIQIAHEVTPGDYEVRVVDEDERTSNSVSFTVTEDDAEPEEMTIESIDGSISLAVGEEGTWTVNVSGADSDLRYSVKWGDEGAFRSLMSVFDDEGQASATFTHTYENSGTYTPEFTVTDEEGNVVSKSAAEVVVGEDDSVHIESIDPASAEAGSKVIVTGSGFDGDTKVWIGRVAARDVNVESDNTLTFTVPSLRVGDYRLSVTSDEGRSNMIAFEVVMESVSRVSISGVDAPTGLEVDEEGTWTVHADSNSEGNLKYSVDWGENQMMLRATSESEWTQSSATFTHAYVEPGTYHPKFTVTDEDGNSSSVSASVVVR